MVLYVTLGDDATITVLIDRIINFLLYLAAPIAALMTVYAGFLFITRGDKPEEIKKRAKCFFILLLVLLCLYFQNLL